MTVIEPQHTHTPVVETAPPVSAPPEPAPPEPAQVMPTGELRQQVNYPQPGVAVLTVTGEIDAATTPRLDEMLQSRLCSQLARLVLDLSAVDFLAVTGIATLQTAEHRARTSGATFVVNTGDNRAATRALQATASQHSLRWHTGPVASSLPGGEPPAED